MAFARKSTRTVTILLIGVAIGLLLRWPQYLTSGQHFGTVYADEECPHLFDWISVDGPTELTGQVTIGSSSSTMDTVTIEANELDVSVSGTAYMEYERGYNTYIGRNEPGYAYATEAAQAGYLAFVSTGLTLSMGNSGLVSIGDYHEEEIEGVSLPYDINGVQLVGFDPNDENRPVVSMANLAEDNGSGSVTLGALAGDAASAIQIDSSGSINILLGVEAPAVAASRQTNQQRLTNQGAPQGAPAPVPGTNLLLGAPLPRPEDVVSTAANNATVRAGR